MTVVREIPYVQPDHPPACKVCDTEPATWYRPARQYLCAGCIADYVIVHAPRRQEP